MNGAHDLGGMMGFGPVRPEPESVRFHAEWEKRTLALTLASMATGVWTIDAMRSSRESLHPARYLASTYYQIWLEGLIGRLIAEGLVTAEEIARGSPAGPGRAVPRILSGDRVAAALAAGTQYARPPTVDAAFRVGDAVRTRMLNPAHHTRLPRYARDKRGTVEAVRGVFVLPDTSAHGLGDNPDWLYTVRFQGTELWGADADPTVTNSIDAWESYLEPAA